eukprot:scaffold150524_cov51-Attheya_sp.AAC.1
MSHQSPFEHLLCPILLQLPFNAVMAEDGQIYEQSAILEHFEANGHTSPITRAAIGDKLIPSVQIKSLIESAIWDGLITGELADNWKAKEGERNEFDELVRKAEGGDTVAMFSVGLSYFLGEKGVGKDGKAAYEWWKRASDKGNVRGMGIVGSCLLDSVEGIDVENNVASGIMHLTMAAERGSDTACIRLGLVLANGIDDLPKDPSKAVYFLTKGLSGACEHCHAHIDLKEEARVDLRRLKEEVSASDTSP